MTYSLTELEALHAKATPGEWKQEDTLILVDTVEYDGAASQTAIAEAYVPADCSSIVELHNAFPALAADLRRLEAERDRLRAALERLDPGMNSLDSAAIAETGEQP